MDDAELRRRRAQSQRDRVRNQRGEEENFIAISHAFRRILVQQRSPKSPVAESPSSPVPDGNVFDMSHVSIMKARSDKFMRDVAGYAPSKFTYID